MKINGYSSTGSTLLEMGQRLQDQRIAMSLTREAMSEASGISVSTIARMESGRSVAFENWIAVLRVLNMLENLDLLLPESGIVPSDYKVLGHNRKRASSSKRNQQAGTWKWKEDQ